MVGSSFSHMNHFQAGQGLCLADLNRCDCYISCLWMWTTADIVTTCTLTKCESLCDEMWITLWCWRWCTVLTGNDGNCSTCKMIYLRLVCVTVRWHAIDTGLTDADWQTGCTWVAADRDSHQSHRCCCYSVCYREKSSASVIGTETWKIGDVLLCLRSILPVCELTDLSLISYITLRDTVTVY